MKKLTVEKTAGLGMKVIAIVRHANGLNLTALKKEMKDGNSCECQC